MTRAGAERWGLLAPIPAVAVGMAIAAAHQVHWSAYIPNLAALVVGVGIHAAVRSRERVAAWIPSIAALAIFASLVGPDVDGVHRWLAIGGVRLNMSMALAPWILLGLAADEKRARLLGAAAVLVAAVTHLAQPDAGQATALAVGVLPLALDRRRMPTSIGVPLVLTTTVLAGAAWFAPDPIAPVDHVERILILGSSLGVLGVAAVAVAGVVLFVPLAVPIRERSRDAAAWARVGYLLATFVVTFVGHFPVPVFGAGAGPVLGWYALLAVRRMNQPAGGLVTRPRPAPVMSE